MVCGLSGGVHLFLGYALFVGCCIPFLLLFWGYFIFSLPPTFILYMNVTFDIQGAFRLESFSLWAEGDWLGVINRCKVIGHSLSSFSPWAGWFQKYGQYHFLGCPGGLLVVVTCCRTSDHKSAAARPQGVRFPRYGCFKFLRHLGLGHLDLNMLQSFYRIHWGKGVLPLMVLYIHWYWCKWKI